MPIYCNEIDPYAAQWLRNLMAAGHLASGDVDERPIQDVQPEDLNGYEQCHFFAGIGVWPYALRAIGWADNRPIWSGSCPCQPFSAAGRQLGFDDERHLWPAWFHLITQRRPAVVVGEQVASALPWFDLVQTDLEGAGYAVGAADLCAAGFPVENWDESPTHERLLRALYDCPDPMVAAELLDFAAFAGGHLGAHDGDHIRQRLYFVGVDNAASARHVGPLDRAEIATWDETRVRVPSAGCDSSRMVDGEQPGLEGYAGHGDGSHEPRRIDAQPNGSIAAAGDSSGLDVAHGIGLGEQRTRHHNDRGKPCGGDTNRPCAADNAHALGRRRNATDWLYCRDGKWRPVEAGTFPLADAPAARVGRLRAYGNALDAETVKAFLGAVRDCVP